MTQTEWILAGMLAGFIVLTWINTLLVYRRLDRLEDALEETYFVASRQLRDAKAGSEPDSAKRERIERLKMCQAVFSILGLAIGRGRRGGRP